jgi:hypothetical protein
MNLENVTISRNVPMPKKTGLSGVLKMLEVGDSFDCDLSVRHQIYQFARNLKIKVVSKKLNDEKARVWRVG